MELRSDSQYICPSQYLFKWNGSSCSTSSHSFSHFDKRSTIYLSIISIEWCWVWSNLRNNNVCRSSSLDLQYPCSCDCKHKAIVGNNYLVNNRPTSKWWRQCNLLLARMGSGTWFRSRSQFYSFEHLHIRNDCANFLCS
jgi:hypothetical protein